MLKEQPRGSSRTSLQNLRCITLTPGPCPRLMGKGQGVEPRSLAENRNIIVLC